VDNLKLFITSYELSVFRNSEFSVQKMNNRRFVGWAAWLLEVQFRNLIMAWMLVRCVCCVLRSYGPVLELITRSWESYRVLLIV